MKNRASAAYLFDQAALFFQAEDRLVPHDKEVSLFSSFYIKNRLENTALKIEDNP